MAQIIKTFKKGARLPSLRATMKNAITGEIFDLASFSSAKFSMCSADDSRTKKVDNQNASIVGDGSTGELQYDWGATDTNTVGKYYGEFILIDSGGKKWYLPTEDTLVIQIVEHYGT